MDELKFNFEIDGVLLKYRAEDEELPFSLINKNYIQGDDGSMPLTTRQFNALRKMLDASAVIIDESIREED